MAQSEYFDNKEIEEVISEEYNSKNLRFKSNEWYEIEPLTETETPFMLQNDENTTEIHYPGTNYLGPGTHTKSNIMKGLQPTSKTDAIARQHDLDYLVGEEPILADLKAIGKSFAIADEPLQTTALRSGLALKALADTAFHLLPIDNPIHPKATTYTKEELKNIYDYLENYKVMNGFTGDW